MEVFRCCRAMASSTCALKNSRGDSLLTSPSAITPPEDAPSAESCSLKPCLPGVVQLPFLRIASGFRQDYRDSALRRQIRSVGADGFQSEAAGIRSLRFRTFHFALCTLHF